MVSGSTSQPAFSVDDIAQAYKLYQSYEKNKEAIKGGKVTDLFFVRTGHGLEFVKKYSLKGQWLRFVNWVQKKQGKEATTFAVEAHMQKMGEVIEKFFQAEDPKNMEKLAEQLQVGAKTDEKGNVIVSPGQVLRENLLELGIHLNQLKYRVERSRFETKISRENEAIVRIVSQATEATRKVKLAEKELKEAEKAKKDTTLLQQALQRAEKEAKEVGAGAVEFLAEKNISVTPIRKEGPIALYAARVQGCYETMQGQYSETMQAIKQNVKKTLEGASESELETVSRVIWASGKKTQIEAELRDKTTTTLVQVLRKSLTLPQKLETRRDIQNALKKLKPEVAKAAPTFDQKALEGATLGITSSFARQGVKGGDTLTSCKSQLQEFLELEGDKININTLPIELLLNTAIDFKGMNEGALIAKIQDTLAKQERCLLFGGYKDHPMVFEIERQANGSFTLRIYNEESKKPLPQDLTSAQWQNAQGYLEFTNITSDTLFSKSGTFGWGLCDALIKLQPMESDNAIDHINDVILKKCLARKPSQEEVGLVSYLLRPESAGTTASHALQAPLLRTYSDEDKNTLQAAVQLYLFDKVEKQLAACLQKEISQDEFQSMRLQHSMLSCALLECIEQSRRFQNTPYNEAVQEKITLFHDLLDRLENALIACEKKLYTESVQSLFQTQELQTVAKLAATPALPKEKVTVKAQEIKPAPIKESEMELLALIEAIPQTLDPKRTDPSFAKKVSDVLAKLSQVSPTCETYAYMNECFCKKLGSIHAFDILTFDDPNKTMQDFQKWFLSMSQSFDAEKLQASKPEQYGMLFFALYGLERAYRMLPQEQRVFSENFPSILAKGDMYEKISTLRTQDPFWSRCFRELVQLRESCEDKTRADEFFALELPKTTITLSKFVVDEVMKWIENPSFARAKKVTDSIQADRGAQTTRIAKEIAEEQKRLEGYKAEKQKEQGKIEAANTEIARLNNLRAALLAKYEKVKAEHTATTVQIAAQQKKVSETMALRTRRAEVAQDKIMQDLLKKLRDTAAESEKLINNYNNEIKTNDSLIAAQQTIISECKVKIASLDKKIDHSEYRIREGIRNDVRNDPQYWPWGLAKQDEPPPRAWTDKERASFYLCPNKEWIQKKLSITEIVPQEVRYLCHAAIISKNIFTKVSGPISSELQLSLATPPSDVLAIKLEEAPFKASLVRADMYAGELGNYQEVYQYVYKKPDDVMELEIPYKVTIGLDKVEAAPSLLQKASRLVFGEGKVDLRDETRELCQLHCNRDIQIDSVISYFQENPKKLSEPEGRMLFCALLFESDLLRSELHNEKTRDLLVARMRTLLHDSIASSVQLKDAESAANVLWIAATVQEYIDSLLPDVTLNPVCTKKDLFALVENFAKPQLQHHWPVLFESILAASKHLRLETLDTKEEQKLFVYSLLARTIRNKAEMPKGKACEQRCRDANAAEIMFKERLQKTSPNEMLSMLNEFAPTVLGTMYLALKDVQFVQDPTQVGVFTTKDKKTVLSLTDGVLTSTDPSIFRQYVNPVSDGVQKLLLNQNVYANRDDMSHLRCYKEGSVVNIYDTEKKLTFKVDPKKQEIFVKSETLNWCYHTNPEKKVAIGNNVILENFHQWIDPETKMRYLVDPITLKPVYQSSNNNTNIVDLATNYSLVPSPKNAFSSFEDPSCTLYWADTNKKLKQIDFVRLGITLIEKDGRWVQKGAEAWRVAEDQFVGHMYEGKGFLVFEHAKTGEKKVLFPVWGLEPKEGERASCKYTFDPSSSPVARFVTCKLIDDRLVPQSLEARYYVSRICLERANVDVAENLLYAREAELTSRKLTSEASFQSKIAERPMTKEQYHKAIREEKSVEDTHLQDMALKPLSKDLNPRVLRLRMHALYLLTKNEAQFPKEALKEEEGIEKAPPTPQELQAEVTLVLDYLEHVADVRALEPYQELIILQSIERAVQKQLQRQEKDSNIEELHEDIETIHIKKIHSRISELKEHLKTPPLVETQPVVAKEKAPQLIFEKGVLPDVEQRYNAHRLEKTFPFNPKAVTFKEFMTYIPLIVSECDRFTSFDEAKNSQMVSMLEYLSQFADHRQIQDTTKVLLERLASLKALKPSEIHQDLLQLEVLRTVAGDSPVTREKKKTYFVEAKKEKTTIDTQALFSPTCGEIAPQDKVAKQKFTEVAHDIDVAQTKLVDPAFRVREGMDIATLKKDLQTELSKEVTLLAHEELLITNAVAQALAQDPKVAHEYATKKRFYPSIDELCVLCARKNYNEFVKEFYPQISVEGRKNLHDAVQKYLMQKQNVQQLKRSIDAMDALLDARKENKVEMIQTLENNVAAALDKTRAYPADHEFAMIFMIIETTLNIKLRPDQVQNIIKFDKGIQGNENPIMQMIMGAGKTSVIQPILALLLAKPGSLSTVYVPEAQFQAVRQQLVLTLGSTFDQLVFSFPYDIELSTDCDYLDTVLKRIQEVQERGGCLLLSPRQKHSIMTSLYEAYFNLQTNPSRIEKIEGILAKTSETQDNRKMLQDLRKEQQARKDPDFVTELEARVTKTSAIVEFMQLHESDQIDEIDMIMNPKIVFKRPIGEAKVFDKNKNFERPKVLVELLLDLAASETLREEVSIDFINVMQTKPGQNVEKRGVDISEKIYYSKVQPALVISACAQLAKKSPSLKKLLEENKEYIEHFITQRPPEGHPDPEGYMTKVRDWVEKNVTEKPDQDLLGAVAHAVSTVLPTSLLRECGSQYGKDSKLEAVEMADRKYVVRPYEAPNAPKPTMYADPHEKILYSAQYYLYSGIPVLDAKEILSEWQNLARKEMRQRGVKVTETLWYERFTTIMKNQEMPTGLEFLVDPASSDYPQVLEYFQKAISKDPETLREFFKNKLFEQVTLHDKSVTSTPQTLVGSAHTTSGYTGTMHTGILASAMKGLPEVGTDGMTIQAVEKKLRQKTATVELTSRAKGKLADQVINLFKDPEFFTFIDSGGWLKEEKIEDFAKNVLEKCGRAEIEGIVYHDKDNNIVCLDRNGIVEPFQQSRLREQPEKRLTIIAQKYETGTNILQKPTAKAFMSVRKNMTLRDSLQSMFRMRQILVGQSVSIGLSDEVKNHMNAQLLDGLLARDDIRQFFKEKAPISATDFKAKLQAHGIETNIQDALIASLEKYDHTKETQRDRILSFLDCFNEKFTPDSTAFWRYITVNQAKMEQDKNWTAARYKMRETLELAVRQVLTDTRISLEDRKALYAAAQRLFVQTESDSPFARLVTGEKELTAQEAIEQQVKQFMKIYKEIHASKLGSKVDEQIAKCYGGDIASASTTLSEKLEGCVKVEEIPEKIRSIDPSRGGEIEAEAQREAEVEEEQEEEQEPEEEPEVEAQLQQEVYAQKVPPAKPKEYKPLVSLIKPGAKAYDINAFFDKTFLPLTSVLPSGKTLPNLPAVSRFEYSENLFADGDKLDQPSHASNHLATRYLLALSDGVEQRFIFVSHEDASRIKGGLLQTALDPTKKAVLYTLDASPIAQSDPKAQDAFTKDEAAKDEFKALLTQAKFLTLKSNFSSREVDTLKKLIEENEALKKSCREFYERGIDYLQAAKQEYQGSYLQKMLG